MLILLSPVVGLCTNSSTGDFLKGEIVRHLSLPGVSEGGI